MNTRDNMMGNLGIAMSRFVTQVCKDTPPAVIVPTGFTEFDNICPLKAGQLIVLAGAPGMGSSSLAMSIAKNVALGDVRDRIRRSVGVFSLDWTLDKYASAITCAHANVPMHRISDGFISVKNQERLKAAVNAFVNSRIVIDDSSFLHVNDLIARAKSMKAEHDIDLLIIDKFPLIAGGCAFPCKIEGLSYSQHQIAKLLQALARDLNIPFIVLSDAEFTKEEPFKEPVDLASSEDSAYQRLSLVRYPSPRHYANAVWLLERPCRTWTHSERENRELALIDVMTNEYDRRIIQIRCDDAGMVFSDCLQEVRL
jgi:replicative DNA helicase